MILITLNHLNQIYNHALTIYPEECCGLLLGIINDNQKQIIEVFPTKNNWTLEENKILQNITNNSEKYLSKHNRFSIAPSILVKIQKEARNRQLQIIGIYHSHPDHIAVPSEFDRVIAWAEYSYIIVSLTSNQVNEVTSWQLDNTKKFQPEYIKIVGVGYN
ncbi:MAG: M67 family metallopeptidase [cyanobacterium endosymbiont of Rhopalodia musculus]|uniref:M67 family metallopeptidase n=1 Tax=cyanobacterium endosymbiont of Epithemia clementina EcSB TaxID=3034674 RepID=UPI00247FD796|nr:M67 family metallopeptidase [cyanobacterium endosymbiont of Epithemia clementina EcSB]WGT67302.1 M67 family metallopeptidase [cyanobacterium endosymbiont of Epithemia clementina EcSB]